MEKLIRARTIAENGDVVFTMINGDVLTMNKHGTGFWRRVLDRLWEYEQDEAKVTHWMPLPEPPKED